MFVRRKTPWGFMNTCTVIQLSSSIWLLVQYCSCNQNFGVCTCEVNVLFEWSIGFHCLLTFSSYEIYILVASLTAQCITDHFMHESWLSIVISSVCPKGHVQTLWWTKSETDLCWDWGGPWPSPHPPPPQDFEKIYRTVLYLTRKIKIYPKIYILAPLQNIYILTHENQKKSALARWILIQE